MLASGHPSDCGGGPNRRNLAGLQPLPGPGALHVVLVLVVHPGAHRDRDLVTARAGQPGLPLRGRGDGGGGGLFPPLGHRAAPALGFVSDLDGLVERNRHPEERPAADLRLQLQSGDRRLLGGVGPSPMAGFPHGGITFDPVPVRDEIDYWFLIKARMSIKSLSGAPPAAPNVAYKLPEGVFILNLRIFPSKISCPASS